MGYHPIKELVGLGILGLSMLVFPTIPIIEKSESRSRGEISLPDKNLFETSTAIKSANSTNHNMVRVKGIVSSRGASFDYNRPITSAESNYCREVVAYISQPSSH
ncbi:MAG: hypothetical protein AABX11_05390 [Nanoarchaeota archaeon]